MRKRIEVRMCEKVRKKEKAGEEEKDKFERI
jgi:hypothetical protein